MAPPGYAFYAFYVWWFCSGLSSVCVFYTSYAWWPVTMTVTVTVGQWVYFLQSGALAAVGTSLPVSDQRD